MGEGVGQGQPKKEREHLVSVCYLRVSLKTNINSLIQLLKTNTY